MASSNIRAIVCICMIAISSSFRAWAQPTTYSNPVEFSFATQTFKSLLPFDKDVSILFTGIPPEMYHFEATFSRFNRKTKQVELLTTISWDRLGSQDTTKVVERPVDYIFLPNTSYRFSLKGGGKKPLTADQQANLSKALSNNKKLQKVINNEIITYYITPTLSDNGSLNAFLESVNNTVKGIIDGLDSGYSYKPINTFDGMKKFRSISDDMMSLSPQNGKFHEIANYLSPDKTTNCFNLIDNSVTKKIVTLNWSGIKIKDSIYQDLMKSIDSVFIKCKPAVAPPPGYQRIDSVIKDKIDGVIAKKDDLLNTLINDAIIPNIFLVTTLASTYAGNLVEEAKLHISTDEGLAYVFGMDRWPSYTAFAISFRTIDKTVPFRDYPDFWDQMAARSSLLIGLTNASVNQDTIRKGLLLDRALVLGYGFRLWPFLR